MSRYWSPVVSRLSPYVPGEQPKIDDLVKLNTNENPVITSYSIHYTKLYDQLVEIDVPLLTARRFRRN